MSVVSFITLAISEIKTQEQDFYVIAMETRSQNIVPIHLLKDQIITPNGEVYWDIGFLTTVNGDIQRKFAGNENSPYMVYGSPKIGENKINSLKAVFEAKSNSPQVFFDNPKQRFCILKVNKVDSIYTVLEKDSIDNIKHYLSVYVSGISAYKNPISLLNKDYRWVNFWNWVCKNDAFAEKKQKYIALLNRRDKDLYLILYRHQFKSGTHHWIVGMHWL